MKKTDEQLKLEDFWMQVFTSAIRVGRGTMYATSAANEAVSNFQLRFPPAITKCEEHKPD